MCQHVDSCAHPGASLSSPVKSRRKGPDHRPILRGRWGKRDSTTLDEGSVWPNPAQVLLLRAGLSSGAEAVEAWEEWLSLAHLDAVDPSSGQVLPLVYRNLAGQGLIGPTHDRLKLHYMAAWAKNQKLFRLLGHVLGQFKDHGIDALVLQGAALVPLYYRDEGTRGMGDFDVLVPEARFREACSVLRAEGWRPLYYDPDRFDTRFEHLSLIHISEPTRRNQSSRMPSSA